MRFDITERTIQRIEGGEPSSVDTRRALARAFDWQDIDIFNKPWPMMWARMQDYLRDYADVDDCYTATEKLQVNEDLQEMIDALNAAGLAVGGGTRHVRVTFPLAAKESTPLRWTVSYFIICAEKAFPSTIRVPRTGTLGA